MRPLQQPASPLVGYGPPPRGLVADFLAVLLNRSYWGISGARVKQSLRGEISYLAALWTVGSVVMASVTWAIVSEDIVVLIAFVSMSLAITTLVRTALWFGEARHEHTARRIGGWDGERVRMQERLERLQIEFAHAARISTLGELTASIAHEVNQPLGAIAVNCEAGLRWLDHPQPNLEEVRGLMRRSLADARRAADIIDRVRGMAVRGAPERVLVPLHDVILDALKFLRHEIEWHGIIVSNVCSAATSHVLADRTMMHQIIVNLAVNAMQAMAHVGAAERRITIRTTSPDETTVQCSVEDSGPGIAPDLLSRLFESFFTTKPSGMGMGLSVCRSIVEAHGGRIEADNASAHGGARLSFTLPVAS